MKITEEMIEAAAYAIYATFTARRKMKDCWTKLSPEMRQNYRDEAHAALTAALVNEPAS